MDFRKIRDIMEYILVGLAVISIVILCNLGEQVKTLNRQRLPMTAVVHDRSNKAIITYESTNVVKDGILYLYDASELERVDVSAQIE